MLRESQKQIATSQKIISLQLEMGIGFKKVLKINFKPLNFFLYLVQAHILPAGAHSLL